MGTTQTTGGMMNRQTPAGAALSLYAPLLGMLPPDFAGATLRPWFQSAQIAPLAPSTTGLASWTADANFDYAIFYACVKVRSTDNLTVISDPPLLVSISDNNNASFNPLNLANDIANVFGTAQQPAIWIAPLIVRAVTGINISTQNLHNATSMNVRYTFIGLQKPVSR